MEHREKNCLCSTSETSAGTLESWGMDSPKGSFSHRLKADVGAGGDVTWSAGWNTFHVTSPCDLGFL